MPTTMALPVPYSKFTAGCSEATAVQCMLYICKFPNAPSYTTIRIIKD